MPPKARPVLARFLEKIEPVPFSGCWIWMGTAGPGGYGLFAMPRPGGGWRNQLAHRVAYQLFVGEVPDRHDVHHRCDVRSCVNPAHLRALSRADHMRQDGRWGRLATLQNGEGVCRNGHDVGAAGTVKRGGGKRVCRICNSENGKRYRASLA